MIRLGKVQELEVVRTKAFGVYLGEDEKSEVSVLLPKKQVPEGTKIGDKLQVFIYKDSEDRLIATTATPKLQVGECGVLEVKDVSKIGAFLDMGLEKDLLLPFKEQSRPVKVGDTCLVALYVDRSKRLAATMKVYPFMSDQPPYRQDDEVKGRIYEMNEILGAFVAVDYRYYGLIPKKELFGDYKEGDEVTCRVIKVREDGKLDLSPRKKAYLQMSADAETILKALEEQGGQLPFDDGASPEQIRETFHMSKNAFKRAVGRLLKEGKICLEQGRIEKRQTAEGTEETEGAKEEKRPEKTGRPIREKRSEKTAGPRGEEKSERPRGEKRPEKMAGPRGEEKPERLRGEKRPEKTAGLRGEERSERPRGEKRPEKTAGLRREEKPERLRGEKRPEKTAGPRGEEKPERSEVLRGEKWPGRPEGLRGEKRPGRPEGLRREKKPEKAEGPRGDRPEKAEGAKREMRPEKAEGSRREKRPMRPEG